MLAQNPQAEWITMTDGKLDSYPLNHFLAPSPGLRQRRGLKGYMEHRWKTTRTEKHWSRKYKAWSSEREWKITRSRATTTDLEPNDWYVNHSSAFTSCLVWTESFNPLTFHFLINELHRHICPNRRVWLASTESLTSSVSLNKLLNLSVLQFLHLLKMDDITYLTWLL